MVFDLRKAASTVHGRGAFASRHRRASVDHSPGSPRAALGLVVDVHGVGVDRPAVLDLRQIAHLAFVRLWPYFRPFACTSARMSAEPFIICVIGEAAALAAP
jgi:hypothetical protein